jgi:hypothetical protein
MNKWISKINTKISEEDFLMGRGPLTMGYFDNLDNELLLIDY